MAVLTYLRPAGLARCLSLLVPQCAQVVGDGGGGSYQVEVVVVDNNPAGGNPWPQPTVPDQTVPGQTVPGQTVPGQTVPEPTVPDQTVPDQTVPDQTVPDQTVSDQTVPVRTVHEARPGIAAARNRALDEAGPADLLVFIDDDERPEPRWLELLLATHRATGAAAVAGRVVSRFDRPLDPWVRAGGFFERTARHTGQPMSTAATNNLLLDLRVVGRLGLRFDPRLGPAGGEDTLFTRALAAAGGVIVWCDEAVVIDDVPDARTTRAAVLRRGMSMANRSTRAEIALARGVPGRTAARLAGFGRGAARVSAGLGGAGLGLVTGSLARRARGARLVARGVGLAAGCAGLQPRGVRPGPDVPARRARGPGHGAQRPPGAGPRVPGPGG